METLKGICLKYLKGARNEKLQVRDYGGKTMVACFRMLEVYVND